jgi:P27 family predicted phage terminase small subunit
MKKKAKTPAAIAVDVPDCPLHLDERAQAEWQRIVPELFEQGLLPRTDRAALAAYCVCWSRWVEAEGKLGETGLVVRSNLGSPVVNPYHAIAARSLDQMRRFLVEFGMSPAARKRIDKQLDRRAQGKPKANAQRAGLAGLKIVG